jgi:hypothetical protein
VKVLSPMSRCGDAIQSKKIFVSPREASQQLGGRPSHGTLAKAVKKGEIPGAKIIAGQILISQKWIDEMLGEEPNFLK